MTRKETDVPHLDIADPGRVSLLSHDIRATYSELQAALEHLKESIADPAISKELQNLSQTNGHLGWLLREAATLIFPDSTLPTRPTETKHLQEKLTELTTRWQGITHRLGRQLCVDGLEQLPQLADIDMFAMERLLSNLISNTLQHTQTGDIELSFDCQTALPNMQLQIRLRDHGSGFPDHIRSFDYVNSNIPLGAGQGGSGFGLHIAHEVARRLQGSLQLRNAADGGAEIHITLPLAPAGTQTEAIASSEAQDYPAPAQQPCALVAEDSPPLRTLLTHHLRTLGLQVVAAPDGAHALALLRSMSQSFDLIFLDVEMPVLNGLQILKILTQEQVPLPPIVAISAHLHPEIQKRLRDNGVAAILPKPFPPRTALRDLIEDLLHCALLKSPPPLDSGLDSEKLQTLLAQLPREAARHFLAQLRRDLETHMALAEKQAIAPLSSDARRDIERATHSLAGLFATAYAQIAFQEAQSLSQAARTTQINDILAGLKRLRQYIAHIERTLFFEP